MTVAVVAAPAIVAVAIGMVVGTSARLCSIGSYAGDVFACDARFGGAAVVAGFAELAVAIPRIVVVAVVVSSLVPGFVKLFW